MNSFKYVGKLARLCDALISFAEEANDRITVNQLIFFVMAAKADFNGAPMTASEIMALGEGFLNKSLGNTYKVLLDGNYKDYREIALGWLVQEVDPDDQRRRFLRVTEKGRLVVKAALVALSEVD